MLLLRIASLPVKRRGESPDGMSSLQKLPSVVQNTLAEGRDGSENAGRTVRSGRSAEPKGAGCCADMALTPDTTAYLSLHACVACKRPGMIAEPWA